jgi:hypothetical protein
MARPREKRSKIDAAIDFGVAIVFFSGIVCYYFLWSWKPKEVTTMPNTCIVVVEAGTEDEEAIDNLMNCIETIDKEEDRIHAQVPHTPVDPERSAPRNGGSGQQFGALMDYQVSW